MNIKQIRELAQILRQNELSALEITEGETCIRMERDKSKASSGDSMTSISCESEISVEAAHSGMDFSKTMEVTSPMVGVFYAAPAPDAEPFVKLGADVKKGDVLCVIEAMKLINEITAEKDGTIVDICVHSGDAVEFGQTLFKLS